MKDIAREASPYFQAIHQYTQNEKLKVGIKKAGFIPVTPEDEPDRFYLAVKNPDILIKPDGVDEVVKQIMKYVKCPGMSKIYTIPFITAANALSGLELPTKL
jgi:hypothetical protein